MGSTLPGPNYDLSEEMVVAVVIHGCTAETILVLPANSKAEHETLIPFLPCGSQNGYLACLYFFVKARIHGVNAAKRLP